MLSISLLGQTRLIQGKVIDEISFECIPYATIYSFDTIEIGKTNIEGQFKIEIPQNTERLIFAFVGMEWAPIKLHSNCDTIEIIMMNSSTYDFISLKKVERLRMKRFKKLPKLHKEAYEKGIFKTLESCYEQTFNYYSLTK